MRRRVKIGTLKPGYWLLNDFLSILFILIAKI